MSRTETDEDTTDAKRPSPVFATDSIVQLALDSKRRGVLSSRSSHSRLRHDEKMYTRVRGAHSKAVQRRMFVLPTKMAKWIFGSVQLYRENASKLNLINGHKKANIWTKYLWCVFDGALDVFTACKPTFS